jgi:hypothetical protein
MIARYITLVILLLTVGWLVHAPDWEPLIGFATAFAAYVAQEWKWTRKPPIDGRWEYLVVSANNQFSHKGDCNIRQNEAHVTIRGTRRFTRIKEGARVICKPVHISWNSEWAQWCNDSFLRFEYAISLPDPRRGGQNIRAICKVEMPSHNINEMTGKFYVLPPFEKSALNCNWGDITLTRLAPGASVSPPVDDGEPGTPSDLSSQNDVPAYHRLSTDTDRN